MKILQLNVSKLRGIVDIELKFNGENAVIWGANGVGKSAVVDAIDFLFTGDITRLTGKSTGDVSVKSHGPHVGYLPADAIVMATIQDEAGAIFTASRSVADKSNVNVPVEYKAQFDKLSENALNGAHFLSRRELLDYILTTPTKRSEQIQTLLNITDLKSAREIFFKLVKKAKTIVQDEKGKYDNNVTALKKELGIASNDQLLDRINYYRLILGGVNLSSLEETDFISGLSYTNTQKENLSSIISGLDNFCSYLPIYIDDCTFYVNSLKEVVRKIDAEEGTVTDKNSIALIKAGIDLLSGNGQCPLCLTQWASEEELKTLLLERRRKGEVISLLIDDFSISIKKLAAEMQKYQSSLSTLINQVKTIENGIFDLSVLEDAQKDVAVFSDIQNVKIGLFPDKQDDIDKYLKTYSLEATIKAINVITTYIKPMIDTQSKTRAEAWGKLNNSKNLYSLICEYKVKQLTYLQTLKKAEELLKIYDTSQEEQLNSLFQSISDRFAIFYKTMHSDDESDFSVSIENVKTGISLNVDFHGLGQYPPMAYHSEGHQDSMGISLFFALMESLTVPNFEVVVLDDVVMSVDIEHRKNFCKVLTDYFPNKQFIITTHDQIWARHLMDNGIVPNKNYIHFSTWSVDAGPTVSIGHNIWELSRKKADSNLNEASAFLRREMECFFENICDKLSAKLRYNSAHRWGFGEYMNAAHSSLKDIYSTAKKHAEKFSNAELKQKINDTESALTRYRKVLDTNNWVTNTLVHYNPKYSVAKSEFLSALKAMEDFCGCFQCSDCNRSLSLIFDGLNPSMLRCRCGKQMYPVQ